MTGTPAARAAAATPAGALPRRVCASNDPSPVTTSAPRHPVGETDQVQDQLYTGAEGCPEDRHGCEGDTAGRTGAGNVGTVPTGRRRHDRRPVGQRLVEHDDILGCRAFLRAVHDRSAMRPVERVVDVGRDDDLGGAKRGVQVGQIQPTQPAEPAAATGQRLAFLVEQGAPRASTIPAPPSVLALPPTPSTTRSQPASSAARRTSPVPWLEATSGAAGRRAAVVGQTRRRVRRPRHRHVRRRRCRPLHRSGPPPEPEPGDTQPKLLPRPCRRHRPRPGADPPGHRVPPNSARRRRARRPGPRSATP